MRRVVYGAAVVLIAVTGVVLLKIGLSSPRYSDLDRRSVDESSVALSTQDAHSATSFPRPAVEFQLQLKDTAGGGGKADVELQVGHNADISPDGNGVEKVAVWIPKGTELTSAKVKINSGGSDKDLWRCYLTDPHDGIWFVYKPSSSSGSTYRDLAGTHESTEVVHGERVATSLGVDLVVDSGEFHWYGEYVLASSSKTTPAFGGVVCERTGNLAPTQGGSRRLFMPTDVIVTTEPATLFTWNVYDDRLTPGEWTVDQYHSGAGSHVDGWSSATGDGTANAVVVGAEPSARAAVRWPSGWYLDQRIKDRHDAYVLWGSLALGLVLAPALEVLSGRRRTAPVEAKGPAVKNRSWWSRRA